MGLGRFNKWYTWWEMEYMVRLDRRHPVKQSCGDMMVGCIGNSTLQEGRPAAAAQAGADMYSSLQQTEQGLHDGETRLDCTTES